jgi:hypothetical protein
MPAPPGPRTSGPVPEGESVTLFGALPDSAWCSAPAPDEAGAGSGFFWELPVHWTVVDIATGGEGLPLPA